MQLYSPTLSRSSIGLSSPVLGGRELVLLRSFALTFPTGMEKDPPNEMDLLNEKNLPFSMAEDFAQR